ncbi:tRNA pseudouridine synthase B [Candidatus Symbiobacter mobilis CR]|uniref:tRNA pseudouridine synthase B n=2 Tax=Candidatus Symbiobacter TaxID=1436289 RepID=U5N6C4_9BURK|nr:tRNA pseudouridine(55) synthase TruB [Candidatus Symbiobacter mobilis]AGX87081.1 tRNA pseudouridine synthase B [Candidatus Symbiobacter mobilis CR]
MRPRRERHPVHGVLLLDKPVGMSSNTALQKARWLLGAAKAGHTGTLDPLASGVLPLCLGAATKFGQRTLDADKAYQAELLLGQTTTTGDREGDVLRTRPVAVQPDEVDRVRASFLGAITQIPPMYSALKKEGKPLYQYAREGVEVDRAPRQVHIYALDLTFQSGEPLGEAGAVGNFPTLSMFVRCSKGTYVRTLAEDIGEALGCGAHLRSLRRVQAGGYDVAQCITLDALEATPAAERGACLLPVDTLLTGLPVILLDADEADRFLHGLPRSGPWPDAVLVAVYSLARVLLGTGSVVDGRLLPQRLLNLEELGPYSTL